MNADQKDPRSSAAKFLVQQLESKNSFEDRTENAVSAV